MCHVFFRRPVLLGAILRDEYLTSAVSQGERLGSSFPSPITAPKSLLASKWRAWRAESHVFVYRKLTNHNVRYFSVALAGLYRLL